MAFTQILNCTIQKTVRSHENECTSKIHSFLRIHSILLIRYRSNTSYNACLNNVFPCLSVFEDNSCRTSLAKSWCESNIQKPSVSQVNEDSYVGESLQWTWIIWHALINFNRWKLFWEGLNWIIFLRSTIYKNTKYKSTFTS